MRPIAIYTIKNCIYPHKAPYIIRFALFVDFGNFANIPVNNFWKLYGMKLIYPKIIFLEELKIDMNKTRNIGIT